MIRSLRSYLVTCDWTKECKNQCVVTETAENPNPWLPEGWWPSRETLIFDKDRTLSSMRRKRAFRCPECEALIQAKQEFFRAR